MKPLTDKAISEILILAICAYAHSDEPMYMRIMHIKKCAKVISKRTDDLGIKKACRKLIAESRADVIYSVMNQISTGF